MAQKNHSIGVYGSRLWKKLLSMIPKIWKKLVPMAPKIGINLCQLLPQSLEPWQTLRTSRKTLHEIGAGQFRLRDDLMNNLGQWEGGPELKKLLHFLAFTHEIMYKPSQDCLK